MAFAVLARPIPLALPLAQKIVSLVLDAMPVPITLTVPAADTGYVGQGAHVPTRMVYFAEPVRDWRAHFYGGQPVVLTLTIAPAAAVFTRRFDAYDLARLAGELDEDAT